MNLVSDKPPLKSLLNIFLTVILGFVIIGPLVGWGITSLFYEGDIISEISNPTPDLLPYLLLMQGIASLIGLIVFPWLHLKVLEQKAITPFFTKDSNLLFGILLIALIGFNFIISISPLIEWNATLSFPEFLKDFERWARQKEDQAMELTKAVTSFQSAGDMLMGLLVIALIPAIGEELVFRGMIQNEVWRGTGNIHAAVWISAFLFSAIHIQFFGFIPRLLLGALFGYLYYWSGNLFIPMFAHFFNNALSVIGIYLNKNEIITIDMDDTEAAPWHTVLLCVIITFGLLYYFRKFYSTRQSTTTP